MDYFATNDTVSHNCSHWSRTSERSKAE
jgi:hypothetical protein